MICFFHSSDLDGHCSGAIIKHRFPECRMVGINYGDDLDWTLFGVREKVFMVDFSLPPSDMLKLSKIADLIWIDHHKTAIEKNESLHLRGARSIGIGACRLVWDYIRPQSTVPLAVQLLAEYDVWNHSNPLTLPFQYGIRLEETWPVTDNMPLWNGLLGTDLHAKSAVESICEVGDIVIKYDNKSNELYMGASFVFEWEGLVWLAANRMYTNSKLFDTRWDDELYDGMLTFGWDGSGWRCSLYSAKKGIDVSPIAVKYGGGGHAQAAGFKVKSLPFKLESK